MRADNVWRFAVLASVVGLLLSISARASVIDTSGAWDGSFNVCCFGSPNAATGSFGQTFTAPGDAVLVSYAFRLSNRSASPHPAVPFDTYIFAWAGDRTAGAPLFSQAGNAVQFDDRGGFQLFDFATGALLQPGHQYIAVIDTSPYSTLYPIATAAMASVATDAYAGGAFYFQDSRGNFANLGNYPWSCGDEGNGCRYNDAVFQARFAPVPVPAGISLTAPITLWLVSRRRRALPPSLPTH